MGHRPRATRLRPTCARPSLALVLRSASRRIGVEHRANGAFLLGVDEQLGETRVRGSCNARPITRARSEPALRCDQLDGRIGPVLLRPLPAVIAVYVERSEQG